MAGSPNSSRMDSKMMTIEPGTTANYSTLKKNLVANRTSHNRNLNMNSSLSIQRLDRELLITDRKQSPKRTVVDGEATDVNGKTAEQLIKELTLDESDDEHKLEVLENETLPGTCKSSYALQFRMQTEADNANFANVSRSYTILLDL